MKKIILTITAAVSVLAASAQEKWTLRQCIDYAVENNIEIRQTELSVEAAEVDLNTTRNSRLPDLRAGASHSFSWGLETNYNTGLKEAADRMGTNMSISTSVPLFQGMRINNQIKVDGLNLDAAVENLNKAKENLELAVAGYYLDVLFKKEILRVYSDQVALTAQQVANTEEMVDAGKVALSQLYDIRSQLASAELNEVNARNDLAMSLLNLSQALNLESSDSFDIVEPETDNVFSNGASALRSPEYIYQTALGIKPHVREAEYRLRSSERQVKVAQSAYYPVLSLGADARDGYSYKFGSGQGPENNIRTQLKESYGISVGLNLSIPIFNRMQTRNSVRTARINVRNYNLQLENVKLSLQKEIQQAHQGAVAAQARYEATDKAMQAAEESFRAVKLRYDNGKATAYEFNEAHTRLLSSQSERLQAKYDFMFRSKILDFYLGRQIEI